MAVSIVGTSAGGTTVGSSSITWPAGTAAGDLAIICIHSNNAFTFTGTGYSSGTFITHSPGTVYYYWKVLTSGDVSSPPTYSGAAYDTWFTPVWTGNSLSGAVKSSAGYISGTSITLTGFTKGTDSKKVVCIVSDRDPNAVTPTQPTGFTQQYNNVTTLYRDLVADVDSTGYTDSASIIYSGLYNYYYQGGIAFEIYDVSPNVGSSSGIATVSGVGTAIISAICTSTGASTVFGIGASTYAAVGTSTGSGVASGIGSATFAAFATVSATATASGIGASIAVTIGTSSGTTTVTGHSTIAAASLKGVRLFQAWV